MASPDLYTLLEVDANASQDDLKKSYRRLARQLHPDANPGDAAAEARFKEVSQAYEILSDPERRAHYDRFGTDANGQAGFDAGSVQDLFDLFFQGFGGGGQRRGGPQPGPDAEVSLDITLHEAAFGAKRELTVTLPLRCETCAGSGAKAGTSATTCGECNGAGQVRRIRNSMLGQMVTTAPCGACGGFGSRVSDPCSDCRGEGRRNQQKTLTIDIPAGVENGSTMRLVDRGPAGMRWAPNGTLYVHLRVAEDDRFERHNDDLHHEATITFAQAVFGATISVPTLADNMDVTVPAGSAHGTVLRLRDQGVTHLRGRGRGDLFVHLAIEIPTELDETSEALLRQFAEHRNEAVDTAHGIFHRKGKKK
jgi:molecular chaperone DnaJ